MPSNSNLPSNSVAEKEKATLTALSDDRTRFGSTTGGHRVFTFGCWQLATVGYVPLVAIENHRRDWRKTCRFIQMENLYKAKSPCNMSLQRVSALLPVETTFTPQKIEEAGAWVLVMRGRRSRTELFDQSESRFGNERQKMWEGSV